MKISLTLMPQLASPAGTCTARPLRCWLARQALCPGTPAPHNLGPSTPGPSTPGPWPGAMAGIAPNPFGLGRQHQRGRAKAASFALCSALSPGCLALAAPARSAVVLCHGAGAGVAVNPGWEAAPGAVLVSLLPPAWWNRRATPEKGLSSPCWGLGRESPGRSLSN